MTQAAEETIGFVSKKNQDWFDENDETISLLIEAKPTKEVFCPTRSLVGGLQDVDGATTSEGILSRWKSHFENLLNDQAITPNDLIHMTPQYPVRHWMSLPPSIQDFVKAIKCMKPGKAPGPDNIPLELLTHGGPELRNRLILLILKIWEIKDSPQ
ncbi:hypothetical protein Pcinc_004987 [Petrolisthes cinctipes]|uniref:Uncharacterized protein n=1 Tax=Petrolisthes cinctipes TaxID=88211 RepID=A0AAE1GDK5_PETCI|nr:hypothetical protein Pcinc_004984 [Petrolisthes cinctipes]KAK3891118.1 hypothetical protein Pcinc_004987 [Petrolisthes cinctipes]